MPLPPTHFLVGAGAADLATAGQPLPRWRVWLVGGLFGVLPDMDTGIGVLLGRSNEFHGIFTHTLLAVLVMGGLAWWVAGRRWAVAAGAAYLSHLLIDLLEFRDRTSVQPLWPLSDRRLTSVAHLFPNVPWERGDGPWGAALSLFEPQILTWLIAQTAVGAAIFLVCASISW
jgi:membrane-bound metal-dependent hydrolase YbcI (DUF457 family)